MSETGDTLETQLIMLSGKYKYKYMLSGSNIIQTMQTYKRYIKRRHIREATHYNALWLEHYTNYMNTIQTTQTMQTYIYIHI